MINERIVSRFLTLTLYSAVIAIVAIVCTWPMVYVAVLLFGVPVIILLYDTPLPTAKLLISVVLIATVYFVVEYFAQFSGAWYTVTSDTILGFGIPLSVGQLLFGLLHTLYILVLYEYFFDDDRLMPVRWQPISLTMVCVLSVLLTAVYLFSVHIVTFAFSWLILLLLGTLLCIGLCTKDMPITVWRRMVIFSLAVLPLSFIVELLAIAAGIRIFAFSSEYLWTISIVGQVVPIEELLFLLVWPLLAVVMYEAFLDDHR